MVSPLLVLAGAAVLLTRPLDAPLSDEALAIEAKLVEAQPDFVVLGNSLAADVDVELLASEAGDNLARGVIVNHGGTTPATWYVMLKNRVFEAGHRPRLVILPVAFRTALQPASAPPASPQDQGALAAHRRPVEPVIDRHHAGARGGRLWQVSQKRRDLWTSGLLDGVKYALVGALAPGDASGPLLDAGRARADAALAEVFAPENTDIRLQARVIPVLESRREGPNGQKAMTVEQSLLPDIADLVASYGARLLVVRVPIATWSNQQDILPPQLEREVATSLDARGVGLMDLRDIGVDDADFTDDVHLSVQGRGVLTRALARRLVESGFFENGTLPVDTPLLAPVRVSRTPEATPLPLDGVPSAVPRGKCAWAVATPGFEPMSPWELAAIGMRGGNPLRLSYDGVPLVEASLQKIYEDGCTGLFSPRGKQMVFTLPRPDAPPEGHLALAIEQGFPLESPTGPPVWWLPPGTTGAWEFDTAWDAPAQGPLTVQVLARVMGEAPGAVRVGVGGETFALTRQGAVLHGRATLAAPAGPWKLEIASSVDAPWIALEVVALGDGEHPNFLLGRSRAVPRTELPVLGSSAAIYKAHFRDPPPEPPAWLLQPGSQRLGVLAPDNKRTPLRREGEGLRLRADRENERTKSEIWLYPGDEATLVASLPDTGPRGLEQLALTAQVEGTGDPPVLSVRVEQGDRVLLEAELRGAALGKAGWTSPLARPVRRDAGELRIVLSTRPGDRFLLVRRLLLNGPSYWSALDSGGPESNPAPPREPDVVAPDVQTAGLLRLRLDAKAPDHELPRGLKFVGTTGPDIVAKFAKLSNEGDGLYLERRGPPSKSGVCTGRLPLSGDVHVETVARLTRCEGCGEPDRGARWAVRWFAEGGAQMPSATVKDLVVLRSAGDWSRHTSEPARPPEGAVQAQICVDLRGITGLLEVDDLEIGGVTR